LNTTAIAIKERIVMYRIVLLAVFLVSLVSALPRSVDAGLLAPVPPDRKPALSITIAVPINHNHRSIHLGAKQPFHIVVKNTADKSVNLWREWCSWGYFNMTFEIDDGAGRVVTIKKKPRDWTKNYPDWQTLRPGDYFVIPVEFDTNVWELPMAKQPGDKPREVRMRAVYEVNPDATSGELSVWTGAVRSAYETYAIWGNP
jgi:hypothetical protein